ncbi:MAG: disaggregatase related repeat-containing protein, partial [Methanosarcina sp.]|nr:disaggregatase related repeat-containing protein [Methanosarcina sp.]
MLKLNVGILLLVSCLIIITIPAALAGTSTASVVYVSGSGGGNYNCDGTDDHIQIQQALEYAASNAGTTVYLKGPFTYNVDPNKMYVPSHTTITGDPTAVIKLTKLDPNFPTPSVTRAIFQAAESTTQDITFHGFEIDANSKNNFATGGNKHTNIIQLLGSSDVTVYDMSLKWGTGDGVKVTNGKNANIHDNVIDRIGHDGVYLTNIANAEVYNNWICVKCSSGVRIVNGDNIKIHDNEIMSKKQGVAGMEIQKPHNDPMNVEIYNNKIYTTYYSGIWVYGYKQATSKTSNIVIHDNEITDCGYKIGGGITIHGMNVLLKNNKITDNVNYDVRIEYIKITYEHDLPSDRPQGSGYKITLQNNDIGTPVLNELSSTHTVIVDNNSEPEPSEPEPSEPILPRAYDNRLRDSSPETVLQDNSYIDVGGVNNIRYRDLMWFNLSEYAGSEINNATLSLYWYYPAGITRPQDTVIEIYRPSSWNPSYVSWNKKDNGVAWNNAGGDWYDKNGVSQGSTPYATITLKGSTLPDNRYYELDVTDLVKEYVNGKYANTGFLIKARTESNNYIAFYSSEAGNENQIPKLTVTKKVAVTPTINVTVTNVNDNRLRDSSPETVLQDNSYIDVGGESNVRYRDVMWFNLSEYAGSEINNATLSLYWYYPAGSTRSQDTVIEIYRPSSWNPSYVSWNKKDNGVAWNNAGGDWYDKNGV